MPSKIDASVTLTPSRNARHRTIGFAEAPANLTASDSSAIFLLIARSICPKIQVKGSLQCRKLLRMNLGIVLSQLIPSGGSDVAAELLFSSSL